MQGETSVWAILGIAFSLALATSWPLLALIGAFSLLVVLGQLRAVRRDAEFGSAEAAVVVQVSPTLVAVRTDLGLVAQVVQSLTQPGVTPEGDPRWPSRRPAVAAGRAGRVLARP